MAKKGPLGTAEIFYVQEKFKSGKEIEEIAKDLDRSISQVQKHITTTTNKKNQSIIDQQFVKYKGATIMTENASTMIDSKIKSKQNNQDHCVTRIKND